jgi:hypothetical protein
MEAGETAAGGGVAGSTVLVEYMGGQLENGAQRGIGAADTVAEAQLRVKTARFVLENYNRFGIEVRPNADSEPQFLSWGAVLRIAGTDQEASENPEEERQERAGGADGRESGPKIARSSWTGWPTPGTRPRWRTPEPPRIGD